MNIEFQDIYSSAQLTAFVDKIGFLPLLSMGMNGWSAEEQVSDDCGYVKLPEGGWAWPLWEWKGTVIRESGCAYGKFFRGKAAFISRTWWADFCNWRRHRFPLPEDENSIENMILSTLRTAGGSLITRELRAACGFNGQKMRSRFDSYVTRLEMGCHIVIEDFVYPHDKHGKQYGMGWALLTTPEMRFGPDACQALRTPEESYQRLKEHLSRMLPEQTEADIVRLLG